MSYHGTPGLIKSRAGSAAAAAEVAADAARSNSSSSSSASECCIITILLRSTRYGRTHADGAACMTAACTSVLNLALLVARYLLYS